MCMSLRNTAQANHRLKVDMSAAMELRKHLNHNSPYKISITDIFIKAAALALEEHPIMNSTLTDGGIAVNESVNIGIAVAIRDGLVVPVLKGCGNMSLTDISRASAVLVEKAKNRRLLPDDMQGGTFTITNLGMFGIESFTAIINPPEVGILAVGAAIPTPVADGAGNITVRPMLELSLTYDHRVVDGAPAALFLNSVKKWIESPDF